MGYIGRNANGFNQISQSALAVTVNGIDQVLITTSSLNYTGTTSLTGSLLVTGSVVFSGSLNVLGPVTNLTSGPSNVTASFSAPSSTWVVTHNFGQRYVIAQAFDFNLNQIIPKNITLTDTTKVTIEFDSPETGWAIVSVGGGAFTYTNFIIDNQAADLFAKTGSNTFTGDQNILGSVTSSRGFSGSLIGTASFANVASSASFIGSLNQNVAITGSISVSGSFVVFGTSNSIGSITTTGSITSISGSLLTTGSQTNIGNTTITGSLLVTGSTTIFGSLALSASSHTITGSLRILGGVTGSLLGTASYVSSSNIFGPNGANSIATASYAATSSVLLGSVESASFSYMAVSASVSESTANFTHYITFTSGASGYWPLKVDSVGLRYNPSTEQLSVGGTIFGTSSWASNSVTASYITGSAFNSGNVALSSSFATSASYVTGSIFTQTNIANSSSYALTASIVLEGSANAVFATTAGTSSWANNVTNGHIRSITSTDTRVQISGSGGGSGSVYIYLNMTGSSFSQNGQIVAFINGLANLY